jgi:hypothetical protein
LSDEQIQKDMAEKLCHICHQPDHIARNCPQNFKGKKGKGGKDALLVVLALRTICPKRVFRVSRCRRASA